MYIDVTLVNERLPFGAGRPVGEDNHILAKLRDTAASLGRRIGLRQRATEIDPPRV
jgi:hypothetical protein